MKDVYARELALAAFMSAGCVPDAMRRSSSAADTGADGDAGTDAVGGADAGADGRAGSSAFASDGCGLTPEVTGTARRTIELGGELREYVLTVPASYDPQRAYPLLFGFHGSAGLNCCFVAEAAAGDAISVAPRSLVDEQGHHWWAEGDPEFFDWLVVEVESKYCIDNRRVFASGFSAGGVFTSYLGCHRGDVLRAIAPVGACLEHGVSWSDCDGPMAAFIHVGQQDGYAPGCRSLSDAIVTDNGCGPPVSPTDHSCIGYDGCPASLAVEYCETPGLGHSLPAWIGTEAWDFFSSLPDP